MKIPGFAAEASLYKKGMQYGTAIGLRSAAGMDGVFPAARQCTECFCDVYDFGLPGTCAKLCRNSPTGLEFPVICPPSNCNPPCDKPTCGSCTQTCSYPGGGSFTQAC
jgi:hypothetical protein